MLDACKSRRRLLGEPEFENLLRTVDDGEGAKIVPVKNGGSSW